VYKIQNYTHHDTLTYFFYFDELYKSLESSIIFFYSISCTSGYCDIIFLYFSLSINPLSILSEEEILLLFNANYLIISSNIL